MTPTAPALDAKPIPTPPPRRPANWQAALRTRAAWAWLLLPLLIGVISLRELVAAHSPVQFNDQWVNVYWWRHILQGGEWLAYFFAPHSEHRLFIPRLVYMADFAWFGGRNLLNSAAMLVLQLAGAACFVRVALQMPGSWRRHLGLATALMFVLCLSQWENFFWGFQVCFVGVHALGVWAIYAQVSASDDAPGALAWRRSALAFVLLVAATLTLANGLFAGLAMAAAACVGRRGWRATALPAVATALLLGLYLIGWQRIAPAEANPTGLDRLLLLAAYITAYLGNVFVPPSLGVAQAAGTLGLAGALAMGIVLLRTRRPSALQLTMFGTVVFVLITVAATGLGRAYFGTWQALSSRYATPTAYFWAAQVIFWTSVAEASHRRHARTLLAASLVTLCGLLLIVQQRAVESLAGTRERILLGASALVGGVDDRPARLGIYPDLSVIDELTPFLRTARLSVFARPPQATVGEALARPVVERGPGSCLGAFDAVQAGTPAQPAGHAAGWAWDLQRRQPVPWIALTDPAGRVIGLAPSGVRRLDVHAAVREVRDRDSGWIGTLQWPAEGSVLAYALLGDGRACRLGSHPVRPPAPAAVASPLPSAPPSR